VSRTVLIALGVGVIAAIAVLYVQIRGGDEAGPPVDVAAPETAVKRESPAPTRVEPPPPEQRPRPERRPPIPTRPPAEARRPALTSAMKTVGPSSSASPAAETVREASNAYANGRYREALERAEAAIAEDETSVLARSLAVLAACGVGRADVAQKHAAALDERRRQPLLARCHDEYALEIE
jgi:type IV secretory pathway VirB10-like protein